MATMKTNHRMPSKQTKNAPLQSPHSARSLSHTHTHTFRIAQIYRYKQTITYNLLEDVSTVYHSNTETTTATIQSDGCLRMITFFFFFSHSHAKRSLPPVNTQPYRSLLSITWQSNTMAYTWFETLISMFTSSLFRSTWVELIQTHIHASQKIK